MKKIVLCAALFAVSLTMSAQVGIDTTSPEGALDVKSSDSGVVFPRVANTNAVVNVKNNADPVANGTVIYDLSDKCIKAFENGSWSDCFSAPGAVPSTLTIDCAGASNTGTLTEGVAAATVSSTISYTIGDGSAHSGQTVSSTGLSGLTATLSAGNFETGAGTLVYAITGTASTSGTASFAISLGGQSCTLTRTVVAAPPSGSATFSLPKIVSIVSILDGTVDIQGLIDNSSNQFIVNVPYTSGGGSYAAYTSAIVPFTAGTGETVSDTNGFSISYSAGIFSATGSIAVTIIVDGDGTFSAKRQLFGNQENIATMDFQLNGVSQGNVLLNAIGVAIVTIKNGTDADDLISFMAHNLGADYSSDPNMPSAANNGNYYQWGNPNIAATAYQNILPNTTDWFGTPYGQGADNAWSDDAKTASDPCPDGFKVPSSAQWDDVIAKNDRDPNIGTFNDDGLYTNYGAAMVLTGNGQSLVLPATGVRTGTGSSAGELWQRGYIGSYWTSSSYSASNDASSMRYSETGRGDTYDTTNRLTGSTVRCVLIE